MNVKKWFQIDHPNPDALLRLFCFPYAGGGASVFRDWAKALPSFLEIVSVRLPGRENRLNERPISSMEQLVESLYSNIQIHFDKPYVFFGHSNGALVSYMLAKKIHSIAQGSRSPEMLILSAKSPPHVATEKRHISGLPAHQFIEELKRLNGTPRELLENPEIMELLLPMLRADFALSEHLRFENNAQLSCAAQVFFSRLDDIPIPNIRAWQDLFSSPISFAEFEGGHFFLHEQQDIVLKRLSQVLTKTLENTR